MEYFRTVDDSKARLDRFRREAADHRAALARRRSRRDARRLARGGRT